MELVPLNPLQLKTEEATEEQESEIKFTEKEKRRLDIVLKEETPQLHVDPSIIQRLNHIDRELNMLRGERIKESGNQRCDSSDDEEILEICEDGWKNETQNRLDNIEETLAIMQQKMPERRRLLPLRDSKKQDECQVLVKGTAVNDDIHIDEGNVK